MWMTIRRWRSAMASPVFQPCSSLRAVRWSIPWSERCRKIPCKNMWMRYLTRRKKITRSWGDTATKMYTGGLSPRLCRFRAPGYNTTSRCLYEYIGAGHGDGPPESHARHQSRWERDRHHVASQARTSSLWWDSALSVRQSLREDSSVRELAGSAYGTSHSSIQASVTHGPSAASTAGGVLAPWPPGVHTHDTAVALWTRAGSGCTGRWSTVATSGSSYSGA